MTPFPLRWVVSDRSVATRSGEAVPAVVCRRAPFGHGTLAGAQRTGVARARGPAILNRGILTKDKSCEIKTLLAELQFDIPAVHRSGPMHRGP